MTKAPLRSWVTPTIDLETITIRLRRDAAVPTVELTGSVVTGRGRAMPTTQATIHTAMLTPRGAAFIEEMKALFGERVEANPKG